MNDLALQLFAGTPGSDHLLHLIGPSRLVKPSVSWVEDGGDDVLQCDIDGWARDELMRQFDLTRFCRVVVTHIPSGRAIWGGRIERRGIVSDGGGGQFRLTALGWYRNLSDQAYLQLFSVPANDYSGANHVFVRDETDWQDQSGSGNQIKIKNTGVDANVGGATIAKIQMYNGNFGQVVLQLAQGGGGPRVQAYFGTGANWTREALLDRTGDFAATPYTWTSAYSDTTVFAVNISGAAAGAQPEFTATVVDLRAQAGRYPSDLIRDVLAKCCPALDLANHRHIASSGYDLDWPVREQTGRYPFEVVQDMCKLGDASTPKKMGHLYVWNRVPYFEFEENSITWDARDPALVKMDLSADDGDWRSTSTPRYGPSGTLGTAYANPQPSQPWWPTRTAIYQATSALILADADRLNQMYMATVQDAVIDAQPTLRGHVWDRGGNLVPPCFVRPGRVIRFPFLASVLPAVADGRTAHRIKGVTYNGENGELRLQLGSPGSALDMAMARQARLASL